MSVMQFELDTQLSSLATIAKFDENALKALIEAFQPLIQRLAKQFSCALAYDTRDEFEQILTIEFWKAVQVFDENKQVPFEWFVKSYMNRRSRSLLRSKFYTQQQRFRLKAIRSEEQAVEHEPIQSELQTDTLMYELWKRRMQSTLHVKCTKMLTPLEANVLRLWYNGCSYKEIAIQLCVTEKSIDNTMMRVKKKLRSDEDLKELLSWWREMSVN